MIHNVVIFFHVLINIMYSWVPCTHEYYELMSTQYYVLTSTYYCKIFTLAYFLILVVIVNQSQEAPLIYCLLRVFLLLHFNLFLHPYFIGSSVIAHYPSSFGFSEVPGLNGTRSKRKIWRRLWETVKDVCRGEETQTDWP